MGWVKENENNKPFSLRKHDDGKLEAHPTRTEIKR